LEHFSDKVIGLVNEDEGLPNRQGLFDGQRKAALKKFVSGVPSHRVGSLALRAGGIKVGQYLIKDHLSSPLVAPVKDLLGVRESCALENYFATVFYAQLKKDCTRIKKD